MRRTGWFLMASILFLVAAVGFIYRAQREAQAKGSPVKPAALPDNINASAQDWRWSQIVNDHTIVEVRAKNFTQKANPPSVDLQQVEIKLYHKDGKEFDLVRSGHAELSMVDSSLYSDGDVEITMGHTTDSKVANRLVTIRSSGVTFDTTSGKATTDRPASFVFENSEGSSKGAVYDPGTKQLVLRNNVQLHWRGSGPRSQPMHVEAGELVYRESEAKIHLKPWSRLKRGTLTLQAADSVVTLEDGEIRLVEAVAAKGEDMQPNRNLTYAAGRLWMHFGAKGVMEKIAGQEGARLETTAASGRTVINAARVDMSFDTASGDSLLQRALAMGNTVLESFPAARRSGETPSDRVLKSDTLEMIMRPGGQEIHNVMTHAPGQLEFLPRTASQRYRRLNGERMYMDYAPDNQLEEFRASRVETVTRAIKKGDPDLKTASQEMLVRFDPKSGEVQRMEQWNDFRYEEGVRRAKSDRARMDSKTEHIFLTGAARVWDPTGSTEGASIELDQKTGDMIANGKVSSTRLPEAKKKDAKLGGSLIDSTETLQAKADHMETKQKNNWIQYKGAALLWQGPNRIEANTIVIQREEKQLDASGNVFSQFREKASNLFTVVRAPEMTYWDAQKKAQYRGNIRLDRGTLQVTAKELFAWFSETGGESTLDRAQALGDAVIIQVSKERTRRGSAEQIDYGVADEKVVLSGGSPEMNDTLKGSTRGEKLTWFARNDRLVVEGGTSRPAVSRILKKGKTPPAPAVVP